MRGRRGPELPSPAGIEARRLIRPTAFARGCAAMWLVAVLGTGCATQTPKSEVFKDLAGVELSTTRLRQEVRALARPFSGVIEGAGDRVLAHAETPTERIHGLRIKVDGVPAVQGALFEVDPAAAVFETAALLVQTRQFIESGAGTRLPRRVRDEVLQAIDSMRSRLRALGEHIGVDAGSRELFWSAAEAWARDNPITTSFPARPTTQAVFAEYRAREATGLRAMAARMEESVGDMALRFDVYSEYIAKQVRWQGELLLEESLARGYPRRAVESIGSIPLAIGQLPFDVDAQREAVVTALRAERVLILERLTAERVATLEWARLERQAIAGDLGRERQSALDALRVERQEILAYVREERLAATRDIEGMITRTLTASGEHIVDHLVLRLAQLLAAALTAGFLATWFLIAYARRRH